MTNEDKQLLLIDLCARLPYKTYIEIVDEDGNIYDEVELEPQHINTVRYDESISIRSYLRPMSSMTEEEEKEFYNLPFCDEQGYQRTDWLTAHHFDYRGLIEKGLALEAPEGMYKTK